MHAAQIIAVIINNNNYCFRLLSQFYGYIEAWSNEMKFDEMR